MRLILTTSFVATLIGSAVILCCMAGDIPSNKIEQLVKTNALCRVRLQPPWAGSAKLTVRTGFFTNAEPAGLEKFERELLFDWFQYSDKPSVWNFGPRTVSRSASSGETAIHTYRKDLPSDAAIRACKTHKDLINLLSLPHWVDGPPFMAGWRFFTVTASNSIDTISITTIQERWDAEINSLEIRRGVAREQK